MSSALGFAPVALACLLIGIPLWTAVLSPGAFPYATFTDPGLWIAVVAGMATLLLGFRIGERADIGG